MPTGNIRPNGNTNTLWSTYDYTNIDDAVTDPTAGDGLAIEATYLDDNEEQTYEFETISVGSVSNVTVRINLRKDKNHVEASEAPNPEVKLYLGGSLVGSFTPVLTDGAAYAYFSGSFNGTWTQAQLDALQVGILTGDMPGNLNKNQTIYVDVLYCAVTYTVADTGKFFLMFS